MLHGRHDADDRVPVAGGAEVGAQPLTDCVPLGPILVREILVDDHDTFRLVRREVAARDDRNAEHREVARSSIERCCACGGAAPSGNT